MSAYLFEKKQKNAVKSAGKRSCDDKYVHPCTNRLSGPILFGGCNSCRQVQRNTVIQRVRDQETQDNLRKEFERLCEAAALTEEEIEGIRIEIEDVIQNEDKVEADFYKCLHERFLTVFERRYQAVRIINFSKVIEYREYCQSTIEALRSVEMDSVGFMYESCRDSYRDLIIAVRLMEIVNRIEDEIRSQLEESNMKIKSSIEKIKRRAVLLRIVQDNHFDLPELSLDISPDMEDAFMEKEHLHLREFSHYQEKYVLFKEKLEKQFDIVVKKVVKRGAGELESLVRECLPFQNSFAETDPDNEDFQEACERDIAALTDALKEGYEKVMKDRLAGGVDILNKDIPVIVDICLEREVNITVLNEILDRAFELQNVYHVPDWIWKILGFTSGSDNCYCNPCGSITTDHAKIHCTLYKDVLGKPSYDIRLGKGWLHDQLLGVIRQMCFHVSTESVPVTDAGEKNSTVANHAYRVGESVIRAEVNQTYFPNQTYRMIKQELENCKNVQVREKERRIDAVVDKKGIGYHTAEISQFLTSGAWRR